MFSFDIVEKIVEESSKHNISGIRAILLAESERAKETGKHKVAQRIDNLISRTSKQSSTKGSVSLSNVSANPSSSMSSDFVYTSHPSISFDDMVLSEKNKHILKSIIREWRETDKLKKFNLDPVNKIILFGPPGTGKSMLASAIANQLNLPLVLVRLDELISSLLGKTGKNIKDIFDIAKNHKVVLFLDEIDTIAKYRADEKEQGELKRIVTVLLQNIDFFPSGSVLIGATNHDDLLDRAIWRRFPVKISFNLPTFEERVLLFELYTRDQNNTFDFKLLATFTENWNSADIKDLVYASKKDSILNNDGYLNHEILIKNAFLATSNSLHKRSRKDDYMACKLLKDAGFSYRQLESVTGIPYTTLKDNV